MMYLLHWIQGVFCLFSGMWLLWRIIKSKWLKYQSLWHQKSWSPLISWLVQVIAIYLAPSYYLNQFWLILNWTRNTLQWNFIWNSSAFIQKNSFEIVVCKILAILFRPQFVNHYLLGKEAEYVPDSRVHGANMGPIWGRQDPGGPHVGPMNFAIWGDFHITG